nr:hypothetical protein [Tanacetum cinerariifolium]
ATQSAVYSGIEFVSYSLAARTSSSIMQCKLIIRQDRPYSKPVLLLPKNTCFKLLTRALAGHFGGKPRAAGPRLCPRPRPSLGPASSVRTLITQLLTDDLLPDPIARGPRWHVATGATGRSASGGPRLARPSPEQLRRHQQCLPQPERHCRQPAPCLPQPRWGKCQFLQHVLAVRPASAALGQGLYVSARVPERTPNGRCQVWERQRRSAPALADAGAGAALGHRAHQPSAGVCAVQQ